MKSALDQLTPRTSVRARALSLLGLIVTIVVLAWAWQVSQIEPMKLWNNRRNAWEYIFGRALTDEEKTATRAEAERQLRVRFTEDARQELLRAAPTGEPPNDIELFQSAQRVAAQRLAALTDAQREREIQIRYQRQIADKSGGFFPPETRSDRLRLYWTALLETVAIAIWGSLLATIVAVPAALLAAPKTLALIAPGEGLLAASTRWFSRTILRRAFDICRGFNEFVMALIFVALIGLGPFAGVLALFVHTLGVLGKVIAEAIETSDQGPIDGVAATGARPSQTIAFAVWPQILPYVVSQSLLRFESNVRSATILGVCGAGGIGFLLTAKIQSYQFQEVCTMMIMVIIVVTLIDFGCTRAMRRFI